MDSVLPVVSRLVEIEKAPRMVRVSSLDVSELEVVSRREAAGLLAVPTRVVEAHAREVQDLTRRVRCVVVLVPTATPQS